MSDYSKVAFSSGFRYERIVLKGSTNFSVGAGYANTTVTVTHNLGYRPYVKSFYSYGSGKLFDLFAGPASYNLDGNGAQIGDADMNTTSFVVLIENFGLGAITGTLYHRIYAEPQV